MCGLELFRSIASVERVHLERGCIYQMPWTDEICEELMFAQHVAYVLTEKALDTLSEFLHALDVGLDHSPGSVGRVGRPRQEWLDGQLGAKVP